MVGPRLLDDGRGCEELLELFEDFFTLVVPDEFFTFSEQLDNRPCPLDQTGDEPGEGGQPPQELLYLLDTVRTSHVEYDLTFVGVGLYPLVGEHEAQELLSLDPESTFFGVKLHVDSS